jgi:tetratricopeptide (TPR) repeat protein
VAFASDRARVLAIEVGLAALTLISYAGVVRNGFTSFDDDVYVTANEHVRSGFSLANVAWAFTTGHGANWHPLTWLSHMLDCELFGLHAAGHHLVSLLLHVATALLLFRFFLHATSAVGPSAFVAAAFALHPLHVESVAWAAERKDVLAAFFWILTTLAYGAWTEKHGTGRYLLVVGLYALGLMSKPMLVTLPFTLLLLDVWPLGRRPSLREKIPLFLLAIASSVVTFLVQRAGGAMTIGEHVPLGSRAANAIVAYVLYLAKSVAPVRLLAYYPYPHEGYAGWQVAGAALLLIAASAFAWRERRRRPWLAVGWLWFLGTLVPVIGLVQVGQQAMADRYTYVPMIGLAIAVAFSVRGRSVGAVLFALAAASWTAATWRQVEFWRDDAALLPIARGKMRDTYEAHAAVGHAFLEQHRWEEAAAELRRATALDPSVAQGHNDLGMALEETGRGDEAVAEYREAIRLAPDLAEGHHNLAGALAERGRTDEAVEHYRRALEIRPDLADTHCELGILLVRLGRADEGVLHLRRALELDPRHEKARRALAERGL